MNRSRSHWAVLALSFACSSDPTTEEQVTSPSSSSGNTSSSSASSTSTGRTTGSSTSSNTLSPSSSSNHDTSTATPSSQASSSSSAPQTTATSSSHVTSSSTTAEQTSASSEAEESSSEEGGASSYSGTSSSSEVEQTSGSTDSAGTTDDGGECVKGMTSGSQVLMIGESFIAATHEITKTIENLARENGSLAQGESYGDRSVSGTRLTGGGEPTIVNQYVQFSGRDDVKYVLMDGGGNDCFQAPQSQPASALGAAEGLFAEMATSGVEKVVYFFYPVALPPIGNDSLNNCLDELRPQMKEMCDNLTSPKCYWLDQREIWDGHPEFTEDGIHPTSAGSKASAQGIWDVMVENCVAQ